MIGQYFRVRAENIADKIILLLPDNKIGPQPNNIAMYWVMDGAFLQFLDRDGSPIARFTNCWNTIDASFVASELTDAKRIYIQPITQPSLVEWPSDPWHACKAQFMKQVDQPRNSNLVVLCANENSLHARWGIDGNQSARNWDLCVTCYGSDPDAISPPYEYLCHQPGLPKWRALFNLFFNGSPLWNYDYVWLPDDDLMTSVTAIASLFSISRQFNLILAQPSIDPASNVNHPITGTDEEYFLRFTTFVEIMCPLLRLDYLKASVGLFRDTISGYGLDNVWPFLLAGLPARVAIIDAISVAHTRPIGRNYNGVAAVAEGKAMQKLFDAFYGAEVLGGIKRNKHFDF